MTTFTVRIGTPAMSGIEPLAELGINTRLTDVSWTLSESGLAGASIGLNPIWREPMAGPLREPIEIPTRAHVEILAGSEVLYEGYTGRRSWGMGGVAGIRVKGYEASLNDKWWKRTDLTDPISSGEMVAMALRERTPWLRPGVAGETWIDPQVSHSGGMASVARMTVAQIVDMVRQEGDSRGRAVWVMVMPGRRVWIVPRVAPAVPDYVIPHDHRVVRYEDGDDGMAAEVTIEAGSGSSGTLGTAVVATGFVDTWKFGPELILPAGANGNATALAQTELARRSQPPVWVTLGATEDERTWLTTPRGVPVPYWQVRTGQWVSIGGGAPQPIVGVTVDATGGSATYEVGQLDPSLPKNLWLASQDAIARQRQLLATRGGRLRT